MDNGTWAVSDGQSGSTGDSVSLTVGNNGSSFWAVGGESSDDFSDGGVVRETGNSGTSKGKRS